MTPLARPAFGGGIFNRMKGAGATPRPLPFEKR